MAVHVTLTAAKCGLVFLISLAISAWVISAFLGDLDENVIRSHEQHPRSWRGPYPGPELNYLHWFVQVSDIHVSRYYDKARISDLDHFCRDNLVKVIKPEVVLASGDLTDSKYPDRQGSVQYEDEWQNYHRTLHSTNVLNTTVWLDIRGNHDAFDVPALESRRNFFRFYSSRGKHSKQSYRYTHTTSDGDKISFIGVDATPVPGPKRPFNFFGMLTEPTLQQLEDYRLQSLGSNATVWFGHYPTSFIGSIDHMDPGLDKVLRNGSVYMCGHLHTLSGLVPNMYSMHKAGTLELELGDWKDGRIYRIFALDHDLFSFTDEVYGTWPVILVTNPKHGQFIMPQHEPTGRLLKSTHIRMLVFSNATIGEVQVSIDGTSAELAKNVEGPLYVLPWDPTLYATGVHSLKVYVKDGQGRERTIRQPFTLDNTKIPFGRIPRFILLAHHSLLAKCLFALMFLATVLPLIFMRMSSTRNSVSVSGEWRGCVARQVQVWLRRFALVSSTNCVFYPLLAFHVYVAIGPWFIGEILTGHLGMCFVFGLWVDGVLIPASLTYIYGVFQLLTFNMPLQLYLGWCMDVSLSQHKNELSSIGSRICHMLWDYGIVTVLIIWQAYLAYFGFFKAYGTMSFLVCPIRTWSIFLALYLRWVAQAKSSKRWVKQNGSNGQLPQSNGFLSK